MKTQLKPNDTKTNVRENKKKKRTQKFQTKKQKYMEKRAAAAITRKKKRPCQVILLQYFPAVVRSTAHLR